MSRARGVIGRLQQRAAGAKEPAPEPRDGSNGDGSGRLKVPREERDVEHLLQMAELLSPHKQVSMHERLPVPEIELDNGLKITAFSKKELRRFTRPMEAEVLAWLGGFKAGDVFFDIGANCGSLSLTAGAMHGPDVAIVAIEPAYASFESLVRNLSRNGMLAFAVPLQIALMDRTGIERFNYYGTTAAGTSKHAVGISRDQEGNEFTPVETQVVPAFTLDDAIDMLGLPQPTHMKIDVDGAEGTLLRGAARTLARGSIAELLVEIIDHDRAGTRLAETTRLLAQYGYEPAATIGHNPDDEKSFVADYLFRRTAAGAPETAGETPRSDGAAKPQAGGARRWLPASRAKLAAAEAQAAKHGRTAQRALAKLDASAAQIAKLKAERDELRRSYYFSGAAKKLDLREIEGFSEIAQRIIEVRRTVMNYDRLYTLWQAVRAAPEDAPVIEIGSWRGGSARFIAEALQAHGRTPRLYVCDTFTGHAETDPDIDVAHHETGKFEDTSAQSVAEYLAGYPAVEMVVGDIAQTSRELPEQTYGLVHLDVDVYPTTAYCLRHFAPRLAPGAVMVIDDYGFHTCPGVKQAADAFVAEAPEFRLWHLLSGQALLFRRDSRAAS